MLFQEVVEDIIKNIHPYDKQYLSTLNSKDLITLHNSFGRAIRNQYHLWHKKLDDEKYKDMHPDDISMELIRSVHKQLI